MKVLFRAVLLKVLGIFGELIQCHVTTRHMVMHIILMDTRISILIW